MTALNTFKSIGFLAFMAAFMCFPAKSHAQDITRLTESNITAFVERTAEMTKGNNLEFDQNEIVQYLEKHLHKKARFKSSMRYNIPGFPSKSSSLSLDRKEFIESIEKGSESLSDYESSIEIENIKISRKKNKATVHTKNYETGVMPVSLDGATTEFANIQGQSSCVQILMLEDGVIKMYNANCSTVIEFSEY